MTEQMFHEGQTVEVYWPLRGQELWHKAKISRYQLRLFFTPRYHVEFADGTRAVFNPEHVRKAK